MKLDGWSKNLRDNCGPLTPSWAFTCTALDLLVQIGHDVNEAEMMQPEEEKSIEVLSIQAQGDIQKCVEFIVGFGLLPYFLPNVGVPEKVRKRNRAAFDLFLASDNILTPLIKFHRLAQVVDGLLQISTSHPSFASLIIPKHAADILAALLQICKSPISKPSQTKPGSLSESEFKYVMTLRNRFHTHLNVFLSSHIPKSILINSLFLIGEKPKFMREACTNLMQEIMISPNNGVIITASTLLNESSASNVWSLAKIVANLLRSSLQSVSESHLYKKIFQDMCCQCVQMILPTSAESSKTTRGEGRKDEDISVKRAIPSCENDVADAVNNSNINANLQSQCLGTNKELCRIGLFCSLVLMDIDCQMSKLFVWDHLFKPVSDLLGQSQDEQRCEEIIMKPINRNAPPPPPHFPPRAEQLTRVNGNILITWVDIDRVIAVSEVAEGLLSLVVPTGISIPLHAFQPSWSLLFQALVACEKYLERKIQEPEVSHLALVLSSKLKNVFILLFELVSAGVGDKLDLLSSSTTSNTTIDSGGSKCKTTTPRPGAQNSNISLKCAKTLAEFCMELLVNEQADVNIFQLMSSSSSNCGSSSGHDGGEKTGTTVKIGGHVSRTNYAEPSNTTTTSDDKKDDDGRAFRVLADECVILCSIFKDERLANIISQLFRQLLSYENENIKERTQSSSHGQKQEEEQQAQKHKVSDASLSSSSQDSVFPPGETEKAPAPMISTTSSELTQLEHALEEGHDETALQKFVALKLLEELGKDDKILENCVNTDDYKETLLIVELVIRRLAMELRESSRSGQICEFSQTIVFALGFLGTIVETAGSVGFLAEVAGAGASPGTTHKKKNSSLSSSPLSNLEGEKDDDGFWTELQRFTPHLRMIADSNDLGLVNLGIPPMAENILISILSCGQEGTLGKSGGKAREVISHLQKALKDVANPMLPIKGHGLLQLRRLLESKDPETLSSDSLLLQIFHAELNNDDSYVYLMAIQGLATLGLKFHKIVIPILIQEYNNVINPATDDTDHGEGGDRRKLFKAMTESESIEYRMKVGEVLVKVTQQLGDIAPIYRVALTNLLFRIVRDNEPLIRASALSNLGELCHLLKFSLGVILTEVGSQNI